MYGGEAVRALLKARESMVREEQRGLSLGSMGINRIIFRELDFDFSYKKEYEKLI